MFLFYFYLSAPVFSYPHELIRILFLNYNMCHICLALQFTCILQLIQELNFSAQQHYTYWVPTFEKYFGFTHILLFNLLSQGHQVIFSSLRTVPCQSQDLHFPFSPQICCTFIILFQLMTPSSVKFPRQRFVSPRLLILAYPQIINSPNNTYQMHLKLIHSSPFLLIVSQFKNSLCLIWTISRASRFALSSASFTQLPPQ